MIKLQILDSKNLGIIYTLKPMTLFILLSDLMLGDKDSRHAHTLEWIVSSSVLTKKSCSQIQGEETDRSNTHRSHSDSLVLPSQL